MPIESSVQFHPANRLTANSADRGLCRRMFLLFFNSKLVQMNQVWLNFERNFRHSIHFSYDSGDWNIRTLPHWEQALPCSRRFRRFLWRWRPRRCRLSASRPRHPAGTCPVWTSTSPASNWSCCPLGQHLGWAQKKNVHAPDWRINRHVTCSNK